MKIVRNVTRSVIALSLLVLACCSNSSVDSGQSNLTLNQTTYSASTDASGNVTIGFQVPSGATAFQLTLFGPGAISMTALRGPSGANLLTNSSEVTRRSAEGSPYTVNFPYASGSAQGGSYLASYKLTSAVGSTTPLSAQEVRLVVTSKADADLRSGTLKVNLILVGPVSGNEEVAKGLHGAYNIWKMIYDRAGLALDPKWYEIPGPALLPDPRTSDPFYETTLSQIRPDAVNIFFGSNLSGVSSPANQYGISGSLPAPALPSAKSVIAIAVLRLTGSDGQFDANEQDQTTVNIFDSEVRVTAEELARLTGQYLGLENIVTFNGSAVVRTDTLSDTDSCLSASACAYQEASRSNFMFPYPVRKLSQDQDNDYFSSRKGQQYYPREAVTDQQRAVLNASVLVD